MIEKELGKIASAEFGLVDGYLFGLKLDFSFGSSGIGDGYRYTMNTCPECKYKEGGKESEYKRIMDFTLQILKDAKVENVSELINKPVEIEIESHCFKSFRILTEVL